MRRTVAEHRSAVEALLRRCWPADKYDDGPRLPLLAALGAVLAEDLVAPLDLPPFSNSQMDGFAVNTGDFNAQGFTTADSNSDGSNRAATFTVAATIPAGAVPEPLQRGFAAPIMTGAMVPDGANAVVPIEDATPSVFPAEAPSGEPGGETATVTLPATETGTFVRGTGTDLVKGSVAIAAGTLLTAAHLGLAAALGLTELPTRRRPRALLVTTGDEVVQPGNELPAGKIFDANSILLQANLQAAGVEVVSTALVPDDPQQLLATLDDQLAAHPIDLIVSTGGISAGAFEVVKQALDGLDVEFFPVAMQPGGPQSLGTYNGVPFLGFPGNPVSGVVSCEMFLRPALTALTGAPAPRPRVVAHLQDDLSSPAGKLQVRRGIYEPAAFESPASVREVGGPSSHLLGALAQANALIQIPAGDTHLGAGAKVEVWLL